MNRLFKTLSQHQQVDLISYIKEYVSQHQNIEILVGCDSQNRKRETTRGSSSKSFRKRRKI
jgi:predicted RNase H-related nuclease YkuK (DUF458 family)